MKILSNSTWYNIQTEIAELKCQVNSLKKENKNLKDANEKLSLLNEKANTIIRYTGVVRDKNGRYVSTKKK